MTGFHITAVSWAQGVPPSSVDVKVPFATGQTEKDQCGNQGSRSCRRVERNRRESMKARILLRYVCQSVPLGFIEKELCKQGVTSIAFRGLGVLVGLKGIDVCNDKTKNTSVALFCGASHRTVRICRELKVS